MVECQKCGIEVFLPFKCPYCGGYFCSEHRLPENHECPEAWRARAPTRPLPPVIVEPRTQHEYEIAHRTPIRERTSRDLWFSTKELQHLTISTLLVIAIGFSFFTPSFTPSTNIQPVYLALLVSIFTLSFLAHEMAHKFAAQRYGLWAEFRIVIFGALLTLISIFMPPPFKIISPGAVMIAGFVGKDVFGRIALSGPGTNLIFSAVFLGLVHLPLGGNLNLVLVLSSFINAWIALFNLIPLGLLDGAKVFFWNKKVWLLAFVASVVLVVYSLSLYH
jgi:Zn-dependent protease